MTDETITHIVDQVCMCAFFCCFAFAAAWAFINRDKHD